MGNTDVEIHFTFLLFYVIKAVFKVEDASCLGISLSIVLMSYF